MKYLKLYEEYKTEDGKSFKTWADITYGEGSPLLIDNDKKLITEITCTNYLINDLKGVEEFPKLEVLDCSDNLLKNLNGIELLPKLEKLYCYNNPLEDVIPRKFLKFQKRHYDPYTFHLHGSDSWLNGYYYPMIGKYEFQKKFLTEHPERAKDLVDTGKVLPQIKEEFPALVRGSEWVFFDLKESVDNPASRLIITDGEWSLFIIYENIGDLPREITHTKCRNYFLTYAYGMILDYNTEVRHMHNVLENPVRDLMFSEKIKYEKLSKLLDKLKSYEFQKEYLIKNPDKANDLKPFGFHEKIQKEYPALIVGSEWGFFDLKESYEAERNFVVENNKFKLFLGDILVAESNFNIESADDWFNEKYASIYDLKTIEKFKRKGFAKYLLEQIFDYVKNKLKLNIITLIVDKDNHKATNLYFNSGFEIFIEYDNSYSLIKKLK